MQVNSSRSTLTDTNIKTDIVQIGELAGRESELKQHRLNLIIPALSLEHVFGGIATALQFFQALLPRGMDARIILVDEVSFNHDKNNNFTGWKIGSLEETDQNGSIIVNAGDRHGKSLAIRKHDVFLATAWWTAILAKKLIEQKNKFYNQNHKDKLIYLIQDFEPGFYPWSSEYGLAESTYHNAKNVIAVFNSSILQEYFIEKGYTFESSFSFEPILNQSLRPYCGVEKGKREKKIIVYGRPSTDRNAFEIIIMSLRELVRLHQVDGWGFYSAGETHPKIDLGRGCWLMSLGKLPLDKYGQLLNTAYAGISLMVSPHPSYPPLEMACFGVKVITNNYANKQLEKISENIFAIDSLSPHLVAKKLINVMKEYNPKNKKIADRQTKFMTDFATKTDPFGEIIPEIFEKVFL